MIQLVAASIRIDLKVGSQAQIRLPPIKIGPLARQLQVSLRIVDASDSTKDLGLLLEDGPDGNVFRTLQTFSLSDAGELQIYENDSTKVPGQWLRINVLGENLASGSGYFVIDVYLVTKPF